MLNKIAPGGFDANDEATLSTCVQKVADDLSVRFKELLNAAELFSSKFFFFGSY